MSHRGEIPLAQRLKRAEETHLSNQLRAAARRRKRPGLGVCRWRLREYAIEHGIVNADGEANIKKLLRLTGASKDVVFYAVRYPETVKMVSFRALAILCHGLGCTPGDLITYDTSAQSVAPLSERYKREPDFDLTGELSELPTPGATWDALAGDDD